MEGLVLTCKQCRRKSSFTPNTKYGRCHHCQRILSVTNSLNVQAGKDEIETEVKNSCYGWRKKYSGISMQYGRTGSSLITSQPPRGKRAFLCGVSYKKQKFELQGTTQDLKNMKRLLVEQFGFHVDSILVLGEEDCYTPPTRKNIESAFEWLVKGIQSGDSLVFYFSGHGLRVRDIHGDEIDGFEESICPVDFKNNGTISDNYINETIVRPLISGVTLHAIVDSCHSGTVLDLPHVYDVNAGVWDDNHPPTGADKGTSGGVAICFSACEDYQLAADTSALSPEKEMSGAMTFSFIKAIKVAVENNRKLTYQRILNSMHDSLKQSNSGGCITAGIRRAFQRRILQDPLLSSSEEFDTRRVFKL